MGEVFSFTQPVSVAVLLRVHSKSKAMADEAVGDVVDRIPIYQDAIQPAAKEFGQGLKTVARAVNAALVPVEGFVWGVEQIRDFVRERVARKLENVPPEEIQQPKAHVGVPTMDALRYTGTEEDLAELYANLLATSMDKATAYRAHPGFVDMIKNMSPDEARIMRFLASSSPYYPLIDIRVTSNKDRSFGIIHRYLSLLGIDAGCEHVPLAPSYIDNLERLGLVRVEATLRLKDEPAYKRIEEHPQIEEIVKNLKEGIGDEEKVTIERFRFGLTDLGKQFIRSCVMDKHTQERS